MGNLFQGYENFFDETFEPTGNVREHYEKLLDRYNGMKSEEFQKKRGLADNDAFLTQSVTLTVYNDQQGMEGVFPFNLIPRIIPNTEWEHLERALSQRITFFSTMSITTRKSCATVSSRAKSWRASKSRGSTLGTIYPREGYGRRLYLSPQYSDPRLFDALQ